MTQAYGHSHHFQFIALPLLHCSTNQTSPECCLEVTAQGGYRMCGCGGPGGEGGGILRQGMARPDATAVGHPDPEIG